MRQSPSALLLLPLISAALLGLGILSGCGNDAESDAFGNFTAVEVTVSVQSQGRLIDFDVSEGEQLGAGQIVGLVDTTILAIQRRALISQRLSLEAQRQATLAQLPEIVAQVEALRAQLRTTEEELARTRRLFEAQAATARELNVREGEAAVLRRQIEQALARAGAVREQAAGAAAQVDQMALQVRASEERIADARIVNPVPGTVLTVIARRGETVQIGSPLYTVAGLDTLTLRAYATGDQLPRLRLGMPVYVLVDDAGGALRPLSGTVTWIADEAEFTPTPIQTRDERAELVYAFEVRVPNPHGLLKIGMPGEVRFPEDESAVRDRDS